MGRPTPPDPDRVRPGIDTDRGSGALAAANPRVKRLRRLITQRKARSQERAFVVEGPAPVMEAVDPEGPGLRPGLEVDAVFVDADYRHPELGQVLDRARAAGITVHTVTAGVLDGVLDARSPQPVAAVIIGGTAEADELGPDGPLVVLVDPSDPGNLGTIVRTAEAAGAAGVLLAGTHTVDPTNPKVVRASAGALLRLPVVVEPDVAAALDLARANGRAVLATVVDPSAPAHTDIDLGQAALLLGNEAHGLAPELIAAADGLVTIPLVGPTESLNLAVATAVLVFEAARQRAGAGQTGRDAAEGAGERPGPK